MNRLMTFVSLPRLILGLAALVLSAVAMPAYAVNDWYKVGYSEGYLRQERVCQQQLQQQVQAHFGQINDENKRLRQELTRLRAMLDSQKAGAGSPNGNPPVQPASAQAVQSQYFEYPENRNPVGVREDGLPTRAASRLDDDNDGG
jgi:Skp family chaperone for outer membrane proteins